MWKRSAVFVKKITMFYLPGCPYCRQALAWHQELFSENPVYRSLRLELVDEGREAERAAQYDYYYVPTYYVENDKLHEGAANKQIVRAVFDAALNG